MNMQQDDDQPVGAPEWTVTFGDMMALLLTFFIMLASLSELKEQEKYQALVESVHRQFGHDLTNNGMVPGWTRPRNSVMARMVTTGRARKYDIISGGSKAAPTDGIGRKVTFVPNGQRTSIGGAIYFASTATELADAQKLDLQQLALKLVNRPELIEIRGHSAPPSDPQSASYIDCWELAYDRARNTMTFLVEELGIEGPRIRLSVAGANEPIERTDAAESAGDDRVELYLIEETDLARRSSDGPTPWTDSEVR